MSWRECGLGVSQHENPLALLNRQVLKSYVKMPKTTESMLTTIDKIDVVIWSMELHCEKNSLECLAGIYH